jgi:hypothetical protein
LTETAAPAPDRRIALSTILTAIAQSSVMLAGGVTAVIIGSRYGATAETDGLFTAYSLYALIVVIATSARTALVRHLIDDQGSFVPFNSALAAVAWAAPPIGLIMIGAGIPAITKMTGGNDGSIVAFTLIVLWPAAIGQLVGALAAAMCGVINDFSTQAIGYGAGGAATVVVFLALQPAIGLKALSVSVLIGTLVTMVVLLRALRRVGWRWGGAPMGRKNAAAWSRTIGLGSAYYIAAQTYYVISVAAAATVGAGQATVYTYAYFALGLVNALVAGSGAFVLAAPIAATWSGDPAELEPIENDVTRSGFFLMAVVIGAAVLIGADVAGAALSAFSDADINSLIHTFLLLTPTAFGGLITVIAVVALFAADRHRAVAIASFGSLPLATLLIVLSTQFSSLTAIAIAVAISVLVLSYWLLWLCHGPATFRRLTHFLREVLVIGVPAAVAFAGSEALLSTVMPSGMALDFAAFFAGLIVLLAFTAAALPDYRSVVTRFGGSLLSDTFKRKSV